LLNGLLVRYIESMVYQGVIENVACEQSARMVAMKAATDNAGQLIKDLQLIYNCVKPRLLRKFPRSLAVPLPFNIIKFELRQQ
jgi:hypothetical protein